MRTQVVQPFELGRAGGAGIGLFPGVGAQVHYQAVLLHKGGGTVGAAVPRSVRGVPRSHVFAQVGASQVNRVANLTLDPTLGAL